MNEYGAKKKAEVFQLKICPSATLSTSIVEANESVRGE
jgi:hypothetical protein